MLRPSESYRPFNDDPSSSAPAAARPTKPWVETLALGAPISAALNPGGGADWEELSHTLTYAEVANRLQAAELGGLTEAVWQGLLATRAPEVLRQQAPAAPEIAPTSIVAPSAPSCAQQHVPSVPRLRGRVPQNEETWIYVNDEWASTGCFRTFRLILINLSGMWSSKTRFKESWNSRPY